jgi:hypothetical protein
VHGVEVLARNTGACRIDWIELPEDLDDNIERESVEADTLSLFNGLVFLPTVLIVQTYTR